MVEEEDSPTFRPSGPRTAIEIDFRARSGGPEAPANPDPEEDQDTDDYPDGVDEDELDEDDLDTDRVTSTGAMAATGIREIHTAAA